jgi:hypothetical protein
LSPLFLLRRGTESCIDIALVNSPKTQSKMPVQNDADHVQISISLAKTLLDLPPETILQIIAFLPTTSTASLALCNRKSATHVGSRTWNLLSSLGPEDHVHFLYILSRDLPCHHACHGCIRLHLSSSTLLPANINGLHLPSSWVRHLLVVVTPKMGSSVSRTIIFLIDCVFRTSN